jgi:N-acetylmuramoyl-L-alanine amidase
MIFLSAGHNAQSKTIKQDAGAVNKHGVKEGDLTIEFRELVERELDKLGCAYITDLEEESLAMYLGRIKTGSGSVVLEFHFDASSSALSTGCTSIIEMEADRLDKAFAKDLADTTSSILGIKNRGTIGENDSHRGRLGLMREEGIICLLELCFITNDGDLCAYHAGKIKLAKAIAAIVKQYEAMI